MDTREWKQDEKGESGAFIRVDARSDFVEILKKEQENSKAPCTPDSPLISGRRKSAEWGICCSISFRRWSVLTTVPEAALRGFDRISDLGMLEKSFAASCAQIIHLIGRQRPQIWLEDAMFGFLHHERMCSIWIVPAGWPTQSLRSAASNNRYSNVLRPQYYASQSLWTGQKTDASTVFEVQRLHTKCWQSLSTVNLNPLTVRIFDQSV